MSVLCKIGSWTFFSTAKSICAFLVHYDIFNIFLFVSSLNQNNTFLMKLCWENSFCCFTEIFHFRFPSEQNNGVAVLNIGSKTLFLGCNPQTELINATDQLVNILETESFKTIIKIDDEKNEGSMIEVISRSTLKDRVLYFLIQIWIFTLKIHVLFKKHNW